jgi:hypothetical protein
MAYNRENLLRRIIKVQDVVLEYKNRDVPQKRIFEKYIKDEYNISYSTFNEWIGIPARMQLKKLLAEKAKREEVENAQLRLFED